MAINCASFLLHRLERNALIGDEAGDDPAGILLREEALRNNHDQPDVERDGSEQRQQHQHHPARHAVERHMLQAALVEG